MKSGNTLIFISVGIIIGGITLGPISNLVHSRRWVLLGATLVALSSTIVMFVLGSKMKYGILAFMFVLFGGFTMANNSVSNSLAREYFHPAVAATSIGIMNFFTQMISGAYESISFKIINSFGSLGDGIYTEKRL